MLYPESNQLQKTEAENNTLVPYSQVMTIRQTHGLRGAHASTGMRAQSVSYRKREEVLLQCCKTSAARTVKPVHRLLHSYKNTEVLC
jgi:hypothetical protein